MGPLKRWLQITAFLLIAGFPAGAGTLVQFRTSLGDVEVEMLDEDKPATVANFLAYMRSGAYDHLIYHRSVPNFVLQGGGFAVTNFGKTNATVNPVATMPNIKSEAGSGKFASNVAGTIAMALSAGSNTANSQWFFNLADNSKLLDGTSDGGPFTVFGRVVGSTNTFALYNSFTYNVAPPYTNIVVYKYFSSPFDEVPVLSLPTNSMGQPYVDNDKPIFFNQRLVTVAIRTIDLAIAGGPGGKRTVSWNSATQGTNILEYSTQWPPVWQSLTNIVRPAAGTSIYVDASADKARVYRVRLAY
jgi:cyclophilin family peptidyl-prolyl cis-trans isomerase